MVDCVVYIGKIKHGDNRSESSCREISQNYFIFNEIEEINFLQLKKETENLSKVVFVIEVDSGLRNREEIQNLVSTIRASWPNSFIVQTFTFKLIFELNQWKIMGGNRLLNKYVFDSNVDAFKLILEKEYS